MNWKYLRDIENFKTQVEQVKKPLNIELLLGHDLGLQGSCYKSAEQEVLEDYLKAVPHLTIDDDNVTLQKQVAELTGRKAKDNILLLKD